MITLYQKYVCKDCGEVGKAKTKVKGSFVIEIFLWLFFIIPGLLYSLWRSTRAVKVCSMCGGDRIYKIESPYGKKLLAEHKTNV